ncbi:hypothetical protein EsH8_IV_001363 [Colletotrichum jinshuiense]
MGYWIKYPWKAYWEEHVRVVPRTPNFFEAMENDPLGRIHELVHPSVQIRYFYHEFGLDDSYEWQVQALTSKKRGLTLQRRISQYKPSNVKVSFDQAEAGMTEKSEIMSKQMPFAENLYKSVSGKEK